MQRPATLGLLAVLVTALRGSGFDWTRALLVGLLAAMTVARELDAVYAGHAIEPVARRLARTSRWLRRSPCSRAASCTPIRMPLTSASRAAASS